MISVSNVELYDMRLVIFASSGTDSHAAPRSSAVFVFVQSWFDEMPFARIFRHRIDTDLLWAQASKQHFLFAQVALVQQHVSQRFEWLAKQAIKIDSNDEFMMCTCSPLYSL
jgi:hypothetical protein